MSTDLSLSVDFLSELPAKSLLTFIAKRKETTRFFEGALKALSEHRAFFELLEAMDIDVRFDPDYSLICVNFSGDGPRLGKVWGELRRHGFECASRPKKGDTDFHGWFECAGYPRVSLHFMSSVCRRVQVGVKTLEQPIYETICGELGDLAQAPAPSVPALEGSASPEVPA